MGFWLLFFSKSNSLDLESCKAINGIGPGSEGNKTVKFIYKVEKTLNNNFSVFSNIFHMSHRKRESPETRY